jgi:hypothetical protein
MTDDVQPKEEERELDPELILGAAEAEEPDEEKVDDETAADDEEEGLYDPDINPFGDRWEE